MRYRKKKLETKLEELVRRGGEAERSWRGGGGVQRRLKERRARTNRASDLRRECLRAYPACINKEAAERTEKRAKTARAAQRRRARNAARVGVRRLCPSINPSDPPALCVCPLLQRSPK